MEKLSASWRTSFYSILACLLIALSFFQYRNWSIPHNRPLVVTTWDAFGYYAYLPSFFIYKDAKSLSWIDSVDRKYHVTGGDGWQAEKLKNGNYTFKYLGGVALMQMPLFFVGHWFAQLFHYPQDGFSPPYQYAISYGAILYCLLGLLILRRTLLSYFNDVIVALTLLLIALATNLMQYAADDNGQSHVYIFLLYAIILAASHAWHKKPKALLALIIGYIVGLATMSRPTEAIMFLIPLLWNTNGKSVALGKWQLVRRNQSHIYIALLGGILGILPQLIYWKYSTGSFIYDVGSKWVFLNPWFRVLFGWEKGWFIYTPITIFFVIGLFFLKKFPFKNAILWFCVLNIWIIISWDDWRYGGSYSTRALVQSYPVFAFAFAAFLNQVFLGRWRYVALPVGIFLVLINIFQTKQYHLNILHYNDMNRRYYGRIFLNPNPQPEDMSLLDNNDFLYDEWNFEKEKFILLTKDTTVIVKPQLPTLIATQPIKIEGGDWIKIETIIESQSELWNSYWVVVLKSKNSSKVARARLSNPLVQAKKKNRYALYMQVPQGFDQAQLSVFITASSPFSGYVYQTGITLFKKKEG
ncbi:MAG: hypothetical protein JSS78_12020 [Bacteroidetes bacterium]|nr:hypothetical protein [Bacteroidota bacterium]